MVSFHKYRPVPLPIFRLPESAAILSIPPGISICIVPGFANSCPARDYSNCASIHLNLLPLHHCQIIPFRLRNVCTGRDQYPCASFRKVLRQIVHGTGPFPPAPTMEATAAERSSPQTSNDTRKASLYVQRIVLSVSSRLPLSPDP